MFEFTDDYKTGISLLDEEHAQLIKLLNDTYGTLQEDQIDIQILAKNLQKNLIEYANTHFEHEESYMKEINDPELPRQKKEHAEFLKRVKELPVDDTLKVRNLEEMLEYLVRWIFRHILHSDMMIGKVTAADDTVLESENVTETISEDIAVTNENPFAFTQKYVTGIEFIDSEHKKLFSIIDRANELIQAEFLHDKYDEIMGILTELREYTEKHFSHEEEYMEQIGYPKLPEQKRAHTAFIERLVNIDINELDSIDENQQEYLVKLIDYLLSWLSNHILKSDKLIGEWEREGR